MSNLNEVSSVDLLSFQDFPSVHTSNSPHQENPPFSNANGNVGLGNESKFNKGDHEFTNEEPAPASHSMWSLKYYQAFFDVDTKDILERLLSCVNPAESNKLSRIIKMKPDLYGPFWISTTLIFTIAISGNIANYLQYANKNYTWKYNFHLVSYAASAIICYIVFVPMILWGFLNWSSVEGLDETDYVESLPNVLELVCIYGYSLFIFIPISILWVIQISIAQWLFFSIGSVLSGLVLFKTLNPSLSKSKHKLSAIVIVLLLHVLLAAGLLHFFHVPDVDENLKNP